MNMNRDIWEARVATARNARDRATALNGLTRALLESSVDMAADANDRALLAAAASADLRCTAEGMRNRASIALVRRDLDSAAADFQTASDMAEALGHGGLWASSQIGQAAICRLRSDYDGAIARLALARERAGEAGDHATERLAWNYLAALYLELHDIPAADAAASACWASAEDAGDTMLSLVCSAQLWRARFAVSSPQRCLRGLERCAAGLDALGERLLFGQVQLQIGRLELQTGCADKAFDRAQATRTIAEEAGDSATGFDALLLGGECRSAQGQSDEARDLFGRVRAIAESRGLFSLRLAVIRAEARLLDQLGDVESATQLWNEVDQLAFDRGFWDPAMEAAGALARIAMARGDRVAAEEYLERRDVCRAMLEWETPGSDSQCD